MAGPLRLRVVTPERPVYDREVDAVVVPAHDGEVGILPRHARFLAALGVGELRATRGGIVERFFVEGGFVQVRGDRVTVLCDHAARLADMNVQQAESAALAAREARSTDAARLLRRATVLRRLGSESGRGGDATRGSH